jgi:hypothetical protein
MRQANLSSLARQRLSMRREQVSELQLRIVIPSEIQIGCELDTTFPTVRTVEHA